MRHEKLRLYWTVASGGSHKALKKARDDPEYPTPDSAMVSFATKENEPWPGPDWFLDCGGYNSVLHNGGYEADPREFIEYVARHESREGVSIEKVALRDWMCEDAIIDKFDRNVRVHQNWTIRDHIECRELMEELGVEADPVPVLQGQNPEEYLYHFDYYRDHGLLDDVDHIGIGTLCKRRSEEEIREVVVNVREVLPDDITIHGFGVTRNALNIPELVDKLDTIDTAAWDCYSYYPATGRSVGDSNPLEVRDDLDLDLNDEGQIRNTWYNMRESYKFYRRNVRDKLFELGEEATQASMREFSVRPTHRTAHPIVIRQCVCGRIVDPNDPPAHDAEAGCRHCTRSIETWEMGHEGLLCDPEFDNHHPACPYPGGPCRA